MGGSLTDSLESDGKAKDVGRFELDQTELQARKEAVGLQIQKLHKLNQRWEKRFTYLTEALHYGQKSCLLNEDEFAELEAVNRKANWAKHEGLGVEGASEGPTTVGANGASCARGEAIEGNHIGDLETQFSRYIGRPLKKNEPRYRFAHRPNNWGPFVAIVCLDALGDGIELLGDAYDRKQDAKHSAALQGILHIQSRLSVAPQEMKVSRTIGNTESDAEIDKELVRESSSPGSRSAGVELKNQFQRLRLKSDAGIKTEEGHEQESEQRATMAGGPGQGDKKTEASEALEPGAGEKVQIAESQKNIDHPHPQTKASDLGLRLPSDEVLLKTLESAKTALAVREVYLRSIGKDPKTEQMGAGVMGQLNKRLYSLAKAGKVKTPSQGKWCIV